VRVPNRYIHIYIYIHPPNLGTNHGSKHEFTFQFLIGYDSSDSLHVGASQEGLSMKGQEDELAKILQETAAAMIDVSGSASHSLDQREYQDRTRHYHLKIQSLSPSLLRPSPNMLGDIPNAEKHLGAGLLTEDDADLVCLSLLKKKRSRAHLC